MHDCINCNFKSHATNTLTEKQLGFLKDSCVDTIFENQEVIFKEGSLSLNIVYIKTGLVKLHMKGLNGRDQILKIIKAPNYLGIPTTVGDKINKYGATAIEPTKVCFIDLATFKELLLDNKDFAFQIIVSLCKNEVINFRNCMHKMQKQSHGLLADTLLNFAETIYNSTIFDLPLSRYELADLIGTSRENVSRMLSEFQKDDLIKLNNRHIEILNVERMKRISGLG